MLKAVSQEMVTASDAPRELMVFRVGTQEFCVDVTSVKEIRGWTPATLLPDLPPYLRGVINLRGAVLPIVDVGVRLNFPIAEPSAHHVVVVVWIEKKLIGLLVDAVCDILAVPSDAFQVTPEVACETVAALVKALVTVDDRMIGLIALDRVLPDLEDEAA